ncbi:Chloride channel, voltage gated [Candidatus Desulfofervidus auxilii]|uniref:Chloride channel, voltage gated n=2 Tax=Desulfofervidus auxilii TaxID=1621989 RepID=A0A7U4QKN3_DESA2|nr:Chloride channel, voltage gated [Candidatus Desulfofervidus auxilii]
MNLMKKWFLEKRWSGRLIDSLLAIFIGIIGGLGAILFRFFIKFFQNLFYQNTNDFITFCHTVPLYLKILIPALGGLIAGPLVYFAAKETKGHGVPEIMEALLLRSGRIRPRLTFMQMLISAICIGSGGSVGREGPIVMIGSAAGSTIGQLLKAPQERLRTLVGCGAAAGIAATFNAPIGGVLFAVEILLNDFRLEKFSPIILASVTATTISRHYYGNFPALEVPSYQLLHASEFIFYAILGILCGLVALLFIEVLYKSEDFFDNLPLPGYIKPLFGGLFMGLILIFFPHVFGVGYGTVNLALEGDLALKLLFLLIFIKIIATSITLGSGESGGVFAPSLFIGAMTGGTFGYLVHTLFPQTTAGSGAYALVGMGALVGAATHGPITAILIIFELTGNYLIILPLMVSCIISTFITTFLKDGSIYTLKLRRKGLSLKRGWEQTILESFQVKDIMKTDFDTVSETATIDEIIETLGKSHHSYLIVTNAHGELTGILSFHDVREVFLKRKERGEIKAKDIATKKVVSVTANDNLLTARHKLGSLGISQLPVVDEKNPKKVLGMISLKDIISFHEKELLKRI